MLLFACLLLYRIVPCIALASFAVAEVGHAERLQLGTDATGTVDIAQLPREAQETIVRIHAGGPFPYRKDGSVFANREQRLPRKPRGYYHEYTVPTPGSRDRGARRIIVGGHELYYSDDHYRTFRRILE